jgi:hypothetical protein
MKITEAQDKKIPHVSRFWNQSIKLKNFPPISDFKESLNIHQASMDRHAPHHLLSLIHKCTCKTIQMICLGANPYLLWHAYIWLLKIICYHKPDYISDIKK